MSNELDELKGIAQRLLNVLETLEKKIDNSIGSMKTYKGYVDFDKEKGKDVVLTKEQDEMQEKAKYTHTPYIPYQIYIGDDVNKKPVILNLYNYPHVLINGKTKLLHLILSTLICARKHDDVSIYLMQFNKSDLLMYDNCEKVHTYTTDIYDIIETLDEINAEITVRENKIKKFFRTSILDNDLSTYNEFIKQTFTPKFIFIDNITNLAICDDDTAEIKCIKKQIAMYLCNIVQYGRNCGVQLIMSGSEFSRSNLPPMINALVCNVISFKEANKGVLCHDGINIEITLPQLDTYTIRKIISE